VKYAFIQRHLRDDALLAHIKAIHAQTRGGYGWPRTWRELLARGIRVGKQRAQKLMMLHGIPAKGRRRFKVTTDSNHDLPIGAKPARAAVHCGTARQGLGGRFHVQAGRPDLAERQGQRFKTRHHAMDEVVAWMFWYNRTRLHSTLTYVSPMRFEENWNANKPQQASA